MYFCSLDDFNSCCFGGVCVCVCPQRSGQCWRSLSQLSQSQRTSLRPPTIASHSLTQSANQRSEKGHLCLPGLPGDKEKAVVGGVNPVGTSFADHDSAAGVSAAAVAAIVLHKTCKQRKKHICLELLSDEAEKQQLTLIKEQETYQERSSSCSRVFCKTETTVSMSRNRDPYQQIENEND